MNNIPVLTIGITSYKRVNELIRSIKSVQTKYIDDIEIVVSEDCSPLSTEIGEVVAKLQSESQYHIRFMPNEHNLGYDMNLGSIISKSRGKFIFFLSDDDAIYEDSLDNIISFLKSDNIGHYGVLYAPFIYKSTGLKDRNRGNKDKIIPYGEKSASKYIYDSILFSGLIFRREFVVDFDSSKFKNMNYFQVYMFLKMLFHYGGYYFSYPSILCVADGENAYGIAESSGGNELLANRESIMSILEFNKTLIQVIRLFDEEEGTDVFHSFEKQYSLHSYSGLSIARRNGKGYFYNYWEKLNSLNIKLYPIVKLYYFSLLFMGSNVCDWLTKGIKKQLKNRE